MAFQIYVSPPHPSGKELTYLTEAVNQNWIAPAGPHLSRFETLVETYAGSAYYATALQSGTAALHLGLHLLGLSQGDTVLCQSLTFVASVNPLVYMGATPVFIDSEPETWNMCPDLLEQAIKEQLAKGKKPKAIIAVHVYGMPYQAAEIHSIAKKYDIPILEDAAEALGSSYQGKPCGTLGDFGVFSFNGNKIITTGGGGVLITKAMKSKQEALKLATQAKEATPYFEHKQLGYNYRMSNLNAAVGCAQFEVLPQYIAKRRSIFNYYRTALEGIKGISFIPEPTGFFSNRWLSVMKTNSTSQRERIRKKLAAAYIESRPVWKPMHLQPLYQHQKAFTNGTSAECFEKGLCLPSGSQLSEQQLDLIIKIIRENA